MQTGQSRAQDDATLPTMATSHVFPISTAAIAAGIFILDTVTSAEIVVSMRREPRQCPGRFALAGGSTA